MRGCTSWDADPATARGPSGRRDNPGAARTIANGAPHVPTGRARHIPAHVKRAARVFANGARSCAPRYLLATPIANITVITIAIRLSPAMMPLATGIV